MKRQTENGKRETAKRIRSRFGTLLSKEQSVQVSRKGGNKAQIIFFGLAKKSFNPPSLRYGRAGI